MKSLIISSYTAMCLIKYVQQGLKEVVLRVGVDNTILSFLNDLATLVFSVLLFLCGKRACGKNGIICHKKISAPFSDDNLAGNPTEQIWSLD